jgi:serine/threonine protein kinase
MAEREEPVRRRVAPKVTKLGMDTKSVIARFEAERQALALMDHPGIAKVLDAGATESGRPYFVMELVRGIKITGFCDRSRLPTRLSAFLAEYPPVKRAPDLRGWEWRNLAHASRGHQSGYLVGHSGWFSDLCFLDNDHLLSVGWDRRISRGEAA